jgi:hypothetical protein
MTADRPIAASPPDYLNPEIPADAVLHEVPLVRASDVALAGYGRLVGRAEDQPIEIVRWPAAGRRPVDADSGDQGGTTEGVFSCWWDGDRLMGRNEAVGGHYVLGFGSKPGFANENEPAPSRRVLLWHANYHPDGGQLFFPLDGQPFVVPLALPGDDIRPERFKAFWFDGGTGLYIHPNVWHEGVFTTAESGRFFDKQGRVHARVSCNFAAEFGVLLNVPLPKHWS